MTDWNACRARLDAGVAALGLQLPEAACVALIEYLSELVTWNATHNLTAVRDPMAMVTRHVLDSLTVLPYVKAGSLVDVGSGAGLPGMVLAIARPDMAVALIESNRKKAGFLRHVRRQLALSNVQVLQQRVQACTPQAGFDNVICRAFASAQQAVQLSAHLVAADGRLLLMKGHHPHAELASVTADFGVVDTVALSVPGLDAERHVTILERGLL